MTYGQVVKLILCIRHLFFPENVSISRRLSSTLGDHAVVANLRFKCLKTFCREKPRSIPLVFNGRGFYIYSDT